MQKIEMIKGAKKILDECMGVQEGENVLILLDTNRPISLAEVLGMACKERGAEPVIMIMSPAQRDGIDPPPPVGAAMQKAQVILLGTRGIFHGPSRNQATKAGARVLIMGDMTEEDMYRGSIEADFLGLRDFIDKVYWALGNAKEARITTSAGTDLYLDFRNRLEKIQKFNGVYQRPGEAGSMSLEVAISPRAGTARGVFVCNASTTLLKPGLIKEPVSVTVKEGRVTEINGGMEAKRIVDLLAEMEDPLVYNVVELGLGLNPKITVAMMKGLHNDKGAFGTCHIGIGSDATWGGKVNAKTHWDFIIHAPKIELDGKLFLDKNKYYV